MKASKHSNLQAGEAHFPSEMALGDDLDGAFVAACGQLAKQIQLLQQKLVLAVALLGVLAFARRCESANDRYDQIDRQTD